MRRWVVVSVAVTAVLAADWMAVTYTEGRVGDVIEDQLFFDTEAKIRSFPFTARLLAAGQVRELDLTFREVRGHGVDLERIRLRAHGVRLERSKLFEGRIHVTDVSRVGITATIATSAMPRWAQARLDQLEVAVAASGIRLVADERSAVLPMVSPILLPCRPRAVVVDGRIELSCAVPELPPLLASAVVDLE